MDEDLKNAAKGLLSRLESTEKFILEQAPEVLKQTIEKTLLSNKFDIYLSLTSSILFLSISLYLYFLGHFLPLDSYDRIKDETIVSWVFSGISGIVFFINAYILLENIKSYVLVRKFPKVFLINEIRKML